jgi:hypothetical protein
MFDLLQRSQLLRSHALQGKIAFGVNHTFSDFKTRRKKNLDLVIHVPGSEVKPDQLSHTFVNRAQSLGVMLDESQARALSSLPPLAEAPVGTVLMALEAKACMTKHVGSGPRIYDELNSSHLTIHGNADQAIAVGFVMVNGATSFISPSSNRRPLGANQPPPTITKCNQPKATDFIVAKIGELPTRTRPGSEGYDAIGITVIDCLNDGSPITLMVQPPALPANDLLSYDSMIRRVVNQYDFMNAHL